METTRFEDIADEFHERIRRIVWCTAATVDTLDRTRVRVVHPVWEKTTGWVTSDRDALKGKHLERNPHLSLAYLEVLEPFGTEQVYVDATARWADDEATKRRVWELMKATEPPLGFDPGLMWQSPEDPKFGLLEITPWRIELASLRPSRDGWKSVVWRPGSGRPA